MNKLEQLKQYTTVVADTGDIDSIKAYHPQDATTNPSLLLKAAKIEKYRHLMDEAIAWSKQQAKTGAEQLNRACEKIMVNFGKEILQLIPGRVSTEINADLSFDQQGSIDAASRIIDLYQAMGIDKDRVLIKIASTWEGIQAAKVLEKRGIHCNMTLMFNLSQAILCADAGVTLVSPFVGRIYDWYKQHEKREYNSQEDPGVQSVKSIYHYYKHHDYDTVIMGASFRNTGQIEALAGCDLLTISPQLMEELKNDNESINRALQPDHVEKREKINLNEKTFRWKFNEDAMATEKLAEGIRIFHRDLELLKKSTPK